MMFEKSLARCIATIFPACVMISEISLPASICLIPRTRDDREKIIKSIRTNYLTSGYGV